MFALAGRAGLRDGRGCGIPSTSPRGYHTTARGQSCTTSAGGCVKGCPRAVARSGVARSTGCHTSPGAVWRSKPGANGSRAPVTLRHPVSTNDQVRTYVTAQDGSGRAPASAFGTKSALVGGRTGLAGGPTALRRGSQFGAQFSTVQTPPIVPTPLVTCIAANVCTSPYPAKGNWKSCWVLQPSRVQIPHPPPR